MNSAEIALTLMRGSRAFTRHLCLPHYTPLGWFECDVCMLTDGDRLHEYEIKVSRADFFRDQDKSRRTRDWLGAGKGYRISRKHQDLAAPAGRAPNTFSFVSPEGVLTAADIPEWAGWYEVLETNHRQIPYRLSIVKRIAPPNLHTRKADPKVREHMQSVCYYRMHELLLRFTRLSAKQDPNGEPATVTLPTDQTLSALRGETPHEDQRTNPSGPRAA